MVDKKTKKKILSNTDKLTQFLQEKFSEKEGVDLLKTEQVQDGVFRLTLSCTPESADKFEKVFAGTVQDKSVNARKLIKPVKRDRSSLISRKLATEESDTFLRKAAERYNQSQDQLFRIKVAQKEWEKKQKELASRGASKEEYAREAEVIFRDKLKPTYLDIRRRRRVDEEEAQELYARSSKEYTKTGIYGTAIDILTDFCIKGFKHDVEDPQIKDYFDSYAFDTKLNTFLIAVYHSLWKHGVAIINTYEEEYAPHQDGISSIPGKPPTEKKNLERAALRLTRIIKDKVKDKPIANSIDFNNLETALRKQLVDKPTKVPVDFSVLDPSLVDIDDSLMFGDKQRVVLKPEALEAVRDLMERKDSSDSEDKLTKDEQQLLKMLPSDMKKAAEDNEPYILDPNTTYVIFYRKNHYERYAKPPFSRVFDDLDYKEELKKADFATLDGIVNYVLLVTVGDENSPVTDPDHLAAVADALDTPAKAYHIVWNHTMKMEYITPGNVKDILGKSKYEPVNEDIFAGLGLPRALLDGSEVRGDGGKLALSSLNEKIRAARMVVEDWLYDVYRKVAGAAGFDHFPKIRWSEETISLDSLSAKNTNLMNQAIQKIASWETVVEDMGRDPEVEKMRLEDQMDMEKRGVIISGSPFQRSASPQTTSDGDGMSGRPEGQPTTQPKSPDSDQRENKRTRQSPAPSQSDRGAVEEVETSSKTQQEGLLKRLAASLGIKDEK